MLHSWLDRLAIRVTDWTNEFWEVSWRLAAMVQRWRLLARHYTGEVLLRWRRDHQWYDEIGVQSAGMKMLVVNVFSSCHHRRPLQVFHQVRRRCSVPTAKHYRTARRWCWQRLLVFAGTKLTVSSLTVRWYLHAIWMPRYSTATRYRGQYRDSWSTVALDSSFSDAVLSSTKTSVSNPVSCINSKNLILGIVVWEICRFKL